MGLESNAGMTVLTFFYHLWILRMSFRYILTASPCTVPWTYFLPIFCCGIYFNYYKPSLAFPGKISTKRKFLTLKRDTLKDRSHTEKAQSFFPTKLIKNCKKGVLSKITTKKEDCEEFRQISIKNMKLDRRLILIDKIRWIDSLDIIFLILYHWYSF